MATNVVSRASVQKVLDGLRTLSNTQFKNRRVIGPRNHYFTDTISKTDAATFAPGAGINVPHISQYVASSILLHCFDGWNFISRSFDALVAGDVATSIHMAYYSELRAAMSIMASEGIGIFNRKHIFFDASNTEVVFERNTTNQRLTTHRAAKELMDEWASLGSKKSVIFDCIQVNNRTLTNWVTATGHTSTTGYAASLLQNWLHTWSIDLRLDIDQQLRNETSYRPHFEIPQVNITAKIDEIMQIWLGLEPTNGNRFLNLDMHLLRLTLEQLFRLSTGRTLRHRSFITFIDTLFGTLGEPRTQDLYEFIFRRLQPVDHILVRKANSDSGRESINFKDPLPLICRAILLLRFATGITDLVMNRASVNKADLGFWWMDTAFKYGITNTNPIALTPVDLYADIAAAITNITNQVTPIRSIRDSNTLVIEDLCTLTQFQRVCFWGVGL